MGLLRAVYSLNQQENENDLKLYFTNLEKVCLTKQKSIYYLYFLATKFHMALKGFSGNTRLISC